MILLISHNKVAVGGFTRRFLRTLTAIKFLDEEFPGHRPESPKPLCVSEPKHKPD